MIRPKQTPTGRGRFRRRFKTLILYLVLAVAIPTMFLIPGCLKRIAGGKYDPPRHGDVRQPDPTPDRPVRVKQTLPHTCGLHAMQAAYTAYGLDPAAMDLRYRLGTDFTAIPIDPESTGTLHPDILRVLAQDGFVTTVVDLDDGHPAQQLTDHLAAGQLALAVVYRGTYHWVLLAPGDTADTLWLVDSLTDAGESQAITPFAGQTALSIILMRPRLDHDEPPSRSAQQLQGAREMVRVYERQQPKSHE